MLFSEKLKSFKTAHPCEFLTVEGARFRYMLCGRENGETLVLLNGGMNTLEMWMDYVDALAGDYRVLLFDYPQELPTNQALVTGMHAFFKALGIEAPIFVGASDGGMVAQIYVQKYPGEAGGMILISTGGMDEATLKSLKKKYRLAPVMLWYMKHCNYEKLKPKLIKMSLGHIRNVGQRGRDAVLLDVRGDLRDICGGVADAFDIRDHLDGRGYFPKVARHGLLAQKQRQALVLDAALHIVDVAVPRNNALGQRAVVGLQRLDRFVDGVRRQGAHADERRGKALQLCVERKACVHKGYSFIIGCLAKKHNGRAYFFTCRPVGTAAKQAAGINRSGP